MSGCCTCAARTEAESFEVTDPGSTGIGSSRYMRSSEKARCTNRAAMTTAASKAPISHAKRRERADLLGAWEGIERFSIKKRGIYATACPEGARRAVAERRKRKMKKLNAMKQMTPVAIGPASGKSEERCAAACACC